MVHGRGDAAALVLVGHLHIVVFQVSAAGVEGQLGHRFAVGQRAHIGHDAVWLVGADTSLVLEHIAQLVGLAGRLDLCNEVEHLGFTVVHAGLDLLPGVVVGHVHFDVQALVVHAGRLAHAHRARAVHFADVRELHVFG